MIKRIVSILFTAWLFYAFGNISTVENPSITQIFIALVALVFALVLTVSHWRYFSSNQLRYLFPLKDVAKLTLKNDYKEFASLVKQVIKEKLPYIIGIDKEKYYTEYIDPNDHDSLNRRYLMQAKEKDIHIIKRNGSEVQEISIINYTGDNLEDYFFTYALKKKVFLDIRDQDFIEKVSSLIKPYGLNFSFSYIEHIKKQYTKDNTRYEIQHDLLKYSDSGSGKVWTVEKIERFKQTAVELEKNGYIFFIASYGNYKYGYGVIKKKEYRKLQSIKLKKLQFITVYEFLEKYIGEQFLDNTSNKNKRLDPYFLTDARVSYSLYPKFMQEIEFILKANNLFNTKYSSNGYVYYDTPYFYPQAGTNFEGGVNVKF